MQITLHQVCTSAMLVQTILHQVCTTFALVQTWCKRVCTKFAPVLHQRCTGANLVQTSLHQVGTRCKFVCTRARPEGLGGDWWEFPVQGGLGARVLGVPKRYKNNGFRHQGGPGRKFPASGAFREPRSLVLHQVCTWCELVCTKFAPSLHHFCTNLHWCKLGAN